MRKLAALTVLVLMGLVGTNGAQAGEMQQKCPKLKQGIAYYQHKTWAIQDKFGVRRTEVSKHNIVSCKYALWVRNAWKWRAKHENHVLQHRWQLWLPSKWYRLAICETHLNWQHQNGSYVSAFGISRREYDNDAAYNKAPPWNDVKPPSPWYQYQAALGHYARFGGFSGWGCRGA